jgi:two-component system, NtrC family, sensor histidine kinase AtoS
MHATRDAKVMALNRELQPFAERIALAYPGIEVGYYAITVNAIVAYAPGERHAKSIGSTPPPGHPGIRAMELGLPMVINEIKVGKNVTRTIQPMIRNGSIIGYIWASQVTYEPQAPLAIIQRRLWLIVAVAAFAGCEIISRLVK